MLSNGFDIAIKKFGHLLAIQPNRFFIHRYFQFYCVVFRFKNNEFFLLFHFKISFFMCKQKACKYNADFPQSSLHAHARV